jgi:hypothetical protein
MDDLERLVRRVEQQRLFHELFEFCTTTVEVSRQQDCKRLATRRLAAMVCA